MQHYGDQIRWFIGNVTSISDPLQMGRIRVRILGVHDSGETEIPSENLPWAQTVIPITEGGTNGLGNILGIQPGARVFGIFMDGPDSQLPLVLGSMPKYEDASAGDRSTPQLARGTSTITKTADTSLGTYTVNPYAAEYPHNKVTTTTSGHVIEIDDTPDNERIHIFHKSGTFVEMHPNGDVVTHTANGFKSVSGNEKIHVTGNLEIIADGNITLNSGTGKTINLNSGTQGAARLSDTTLDNDTEINGNDIGVITSSSSSVIIGD